MLLSPENDVAVDVTAVPRSIVLGVVSLSAFVAVVAVVAVVALPALVAYLTDLLASAVLSTLPRPTSDLV